MSLSRQDVQFIQTLISVALNERQAPIGRDGLAVDGQYNPVDGTIGSKLCDTDAMFSAPNQPTAAPRVPIAHSVYGDQYGPRGGERTTMFPTQHGFDALFTYDEDDSPGAPAGEIWRVHRNAAGTIDSSSKWTNDGPTVNDGLGGQAHLAGAFYSLTTAAGWTFTLNDTGKVGKIVSPGGLSITLDDNNGTITLGAGDDPGATDAVIRKTDLDSAFSAFATDLQTWARANFQSGTAPSTPVPSTPSTSGSTKVQSS